MRLGINIKLNLLFVGTILLLVAFLSSYFIRQETMALSTELNERAEVLLSCLSDNVEFPLLAGNVDALERIAERTLSQKNVIYCRVEGKGGGVLFERGESRVEGIRVFTTPVVTERVAESEGLIFEDTGGTEERIGRVAIGISPEGLYQKVKTMRATLMALAIVTILFTSAASSLLLRFVLTGPIAVLVKGTERIAKGDLDYRVPVKRNDEIGLLAGSFNRMTEDLDGIIRAMSDCLLVTDSRCRIQTVNRSTISLFGYGEDELVGKPLSFLFERERPEAAAAAEPEYVCRMDHLETVCRTKQGGRMFLQFSSSAMYDENGHLTGIVCVGHDITERRCAEEALVEQAEALSESNVKLEAANAQLQQLDRLKSDFISNVSHELRTPLTAIGAYAETLQTHDSITKEKRDSFLGIIVEQTARLTSLIEDLLDLSRIEADKLKLASEPVDLEQAASAAMRSVLPQAEKNSVEVRVEPFPDERIVVADEQRLVQVLVNLLNNAIKFTGSGGVVRLRAVGVEDRLPLDTSSPSVRLPDSMKPGRHTAARRPEYLRVTVSDNGIGIPSEELKKIFDRFKQVAEKTRGKPTGTGLGLSICKELVEKMGGSIWVDSAQGQGSSFHFTLPLSKDRVKDELPGGLATSAASVEETASPAETSA
jgi:PAS domain S-box-containing protein